MQMYSEADVDHSCLADSQITILGYGSQGRAHALNLKDSGFNVVVGLRSSGASWSEQQKLTASDGAASDLFGKSVSISGDSKPEGLTLALTSIRHTNNPSHKWRLIPLSGSPS